MKNDKISDVNGKYLYDPSICVWVYKYYSCVSLRFVSLFVIHCT